MFKWIISLLAISVFAASYAFAAEPAVSAGKTITVDEKKMIQSTETMAQNQVAVLPRQNNNLSDSEVEKIIQAEINANTNPNANWILEPPSESQN